MAAPAAKSAVECGQYASGRITMRPASQVRGSDCAEVRRRSPAQSLVSSVYLGAATVTDCMQELLASKPARALTSTGTATLQAKARLGSSDLILTDLLDSFHDELDCESELPDRIREIHKVLLRATQCVTRVNAVSGDVRVLRVAGSVG
jgi:hypothetical protein